ncbi:MAG: protein phosphatase 2C domain-containing protein [Gemmatimonadota bacterium]|nr:protein phosphatase 2C domain-containing protein [Gemmatimonadota bacterium]
MPSAPDPASAELKRPRDDELDLFGLTHQGHVRTDNQDHFLVCTVHPEVVVHTTSLPQVEDLPLRGSRLATILVVADGVGGGDFGSEAAQLATESITTYVACTLRSYHAAGKASENELLDNLRSAIGEAHDAVLGDAAAREPAGRMASTLTVGIVIWPWCYVVQVGDSRGYYFDSSELRQLTRDQTIGQSLVDQGVLPAERLSISPYRNVLASAIGGGEAIPEVTRIQMQRSGTLLFCTDGLTKHVTDAEIGERMGRMTGSEQLCRELLALALERGGSDNITIVVGRAPPERQ